MKQLLEAAIAKWGIDAQLEMTQEEATELALACRKWKRNPCERTFDELANEIADVEIMITQLEIMYPQIRENIERKKEFKLHRLQERIEKK